MNTFLSFWAKLFGFAKSRAAKTDPYPRTPADANPWGVDVVDVTPHTLTAISLTREKRQAENAISFPPTEDGLGFLGQEPASTQSISLELAYPCALTLPDGPVYLPQYMEEKWALFYREHKLLVVSSWLREVVLVVETQKKDETLHLLSARGSFCGESPENTTALLDFVIRSHALAEIWPLLCPTELEQDPDRLAQWCFGLFGSRVHLACFRQPKYLPPSRPIRTHSPIHTASARGDIETIKASVEGGLDPNILGGDELPPLQWALLNENIEVVRCLLDLGADPNMASPDGYTGLMGAAAKANEPVVRLLLLHGANAIATTTDGFTALHSACERGFVEIVQALLDAGADPSVEAQGYTPLALAELREESEVVALLKSR